jgi:hypothetical protein
LDLNFAHYTKTQTFLGLPFVLLKANNEDPSNMREWISVKLFRKMGIPAPREVPAQVYINGQLLGFYCIVEHLDETFLQRDCGQSGGYLYEGQSANDYDFGNLGTDPTLYAQFLDLKTSQPTSDLPTFDNLVQVINQPASATFTDDAFIAALSQYLDPQQFLTYGATEQALAGSDSLIGGQQGMNNFDLYQFQGTTVYYFIPWDKDMCFSDWGRDIMDGISNGPNINLLAQRLAAIPQYLQVYLNALAKAATLMGGTGGWADSELTREYGVIQAAALNDPNKQCMVAGVLIPCGNQDFESGVQWNHEFLASRSSLVLSEAASDGFVASTAGPQIAAAGVSALGGLPVLSPGGLATVTGTNLASSAVQAAAVPLPRVLGNAYPAAFDGRRQHRVSSAGRYTGGRRLDRGFLERRHDFHSRWGRPSLGTRHFGRGARRWLGGIGGAPCRCRRHHLALCHRNGRGKRQSAARRRRACRSNCHNCRRAADSSRRRAVDGHFLRTGTRVCGTLSSQRLSPFRVANRQLSWIAHSRG